ncbi:hypothetical protein DPV78_002707 [Talaromyces pinophilus]|nr:hypothetical protein DPV78_002707 [Talaromyces pinophilus]
MPATDKPGTSSPLAGAINPIKPVAVVEPAQTALNGNGKGREKLTMFNDIRLLDCSAFVGVAILDLPIPQTIISHHTHSPFGFDR